MLRREMRRDTRKVSRKELKKNVAIWQIKFRAILLNVPFCSPARSELLNFKLSEKEKLKLSRECQIVPLGEHSETVEITPI